MIIGLVGRRGSGKDTVADYLSRRYGFKNKKFAGPLKAALAILFGLTNEHLEGTLKEVPHPLWGVTPRKMMQFFGTEIMQGHVRCLIPDSTNETAHAVRRLFMDLDAETGMDVVVSDVRFQHEVAALRSRGALIVRIERHTRVEKGVDDHVSETEIDGLVADVSLVNYDSINELFDKCDSLMTDFLVRRE